MANDETEGDRSAESTSEPTSPVPGGGAGTGPEMDRLPPPAFPPGHRRSSVPRESVSLEESDPESDEVGEDAFISPDEPIRKEARGIPDGAYISPDDPFVTADEERRTEPGEEGTVTGLGEDRAMPSSGRVKSDERPTIHELPYLLDRVAEQIHDSGEQALRIHHDMGHFEAALKSFLKGYLTGGGD